MSKITLDDIKNFTVDADLNTLSDKEKIKANMFLEVQKFLKEKLNNTDEDTGKKITRAFNSILDSQANLLKLRHRINDVLLGEASVEDKLSLDALGVEIPSLKKNLWNKVFFDKIGITMRLQAVHNEVDAQNAAKKAE